jgi:NADH-quinone oxidoreductase subunit D
MDVSLEELRHLVSDRALAGETMLLNMGPQHPSTHGVLRLLLELDGETVINCIPDHRFPAHRHRKEHGGQDLRKSGCDERPDRLPEQPGEQPGVLYGDRKNGRPGRSTSSPGHTSAAVTELERISSHLVWLGTHALDLAAMSVFLYCFREREKILDLKELVSGQRMMTTYIRPADCGEMFPVEFEDAVRKFLDEMPRRIDEYEALLTRNAIFMERTKGIGVMEVEDAIRWGVTGPMLRAAGLGWISGKLSLILATSSMTSKCLPIQTAIHMPVTWFELKKCASR